MSSFLDKAKEKAQQLASQAKEKADDIKQSRKADDLLDDLGRILYRQRTGRPEDGDEAEIATLVAQLKELEDAGTQVLAPKAEPVSDLPPPGSTLPPPPPPAATTPLPETPLPE